MSASQTHCDGQLTVKNFKLLINSEPETTFVNGFFLREGARVRNLISLFGLELFIFLKIPPVQSWQKVVLLLQSVLLHVSNFHVSALDFGQLVNILLVVNTNSTATFDQSIVTCITGIYFWFQWPKDDRSSFVEHCYIVLFSFFFFMVSSTNMSLIHPSRYQEMLLSRKQIPKILPMTLLTKSNHKNTIRKKAQLKGTCNCHQTMYQLTTNWRS